MIELEGKYNSAKVFTDNIDNETISQVINLLSQDFIQGAKVRIMPDCHAGKGCVIGFTANLGDKVIPNLVGVDIGCGMLTVKLGRVDIDFKELDKVIRDNIPSGRNVNEGREVRFPELQDLYCHRELKDTKRIERSLKSLGGGNHFVEVNIDKSGEKYLVIHSGSRNLGKQVAEHYQDLAIEMCSGREDYYKERESIIRTYKDEGRRKEIQQALKDLDKRYKAAEPKYSKDLCYLTGEYKDRYLHDMKICQEYAALNRDSMADAILKSMFGRGLEDFNHFHTVHNYIDFEDNIIRKGSIAAYKGQEVLIPINMRDGSILAIGKGNPDWNYSAPHGAGRLMSRGKAKDNITFKEFKDSMEGIFSTSVLESTIDEAPMAYKSMEEIIKNIQDSVDIVEILKPIYNFKAN